MHFNVWILVYIYFSSISFIFLKFGLFVGHCSVKTLELKTIFGGKDSSSHNSTHSLLPTSYRKHKVWLLVFKFRASKTQQVILY